MLTNSDCVFEFRAECKIMISLNKSFLTQAYGSQFLFEYTSKAHVGVCEESLKPLVVLCHHPPERLDIHHHHLALGQRLAIELPFEHVRIVKYFLQTAIVVNGTGDDVYLAEIIPFNDLDVNDIVLGLFFFEHKTGSTFDKEVDAFDRVVLDEDELVLLHNHRLQPGTKPCYELFWFELEKVDS